MKQKIIIWCLALASLLGLINVLAAQENKSPNELDYLFPFCYSQTPEQKPPQSLTGLPFYPAYREAASALPALLDNPQKEKLEQVIAGLNKAQTLAQANPQAQALIANRLALAWFALSKARRNTATASLNEAIKTLERALPSAQGLEIPRINHNLGFLHLDYAYKTDMDKHLLRSRDYLNKAEADPEWRKSLLDYGKTEYCLGTLYSQLYHVENPVENLKISISHFKTAMEIFKAHQLKTPSDDLKYSIGYAYGMLFMLGKNPQDFEKSISYYDNILNLLKTQKTLPAQYAETLGALGNIYVSASEVKNPEPTLKKAIYCLEKAREICDAKAQPAVYTQIYWDLGFAYYHLAEVKRPEENLKKAISLYRTALQNRSLEKTYTYDYAEYLFNLGSAYAALYRFDGKEENRKNALLWLNKALKLARTHKYNHDIRPFQQAIDEIQDQGGN